MVAARTGQATTRHLQQAERITCATDENHSPCQELFHDASWLLDAGQRFVTAVGQLADRRVEVAVASSRAARVADRAAVRGRRDRADQAQLAEVAAAVPFDLPAPLVYLVGNGTGSRLGHLRNEPL